MDANEPGAFRPCLCFSRGDVDSCAARKWDRRCGCLDWSRMAVSVRGIFRPASIALLVALCGSLIIDVSHPNMVHAGTVGNPSNLDVFEADSSIQSSWWGGGALTVSQRFGCTDQIVEPPAPTGWCPSSPSPYTHWHQGIDMPLPTTAIYSQFEGSVVDVEYAILGIRTSAGSLIYLLHGTPAAGY